MSQVLERLEAVIDARAQAGDASGSHTARLLAKGPARCAQKFGEEAVETVIAAVSGEPAELASECADALYHMLVMLRAREIPFSAVLEELERREGVSGLTEKAARGPEVAGDKQ
ncbi:MAG: phosphoribosyl-ATP diphosphatase [Pseudomonadota bacterium]